MMKLLPYRLKGEYVGMPVHNSVHNIYVQALVGSGVVGILALLFALVVMPLRLFLNDRNLNREGSVTGIITIVSLAIFGISESWTLRLSVISVFLVYVAVIASHLHINNRTE